MSWRHVENVLDQSRARHTARMVLTALATYANDQGICWPGVESVMRKAGVGKTAIHDAFQKLTALGELQIDIGAGAKGCNVYRILLPLPENGPSHKTDPSRNTEAPSQKADPTEKRTPPDSEQGDTGKREDPSRNTDRPLPQTGPEPSENRQRTVRDFFYNHPPYPPTASGRGDGEEELDHLPQEELWRRVCQIVARPLEQPRTAREEAALQDSAYISEENMQLLERHAAAEYARKGNRGKRTARTLLTHLLSDVKTAWFWSRSTPAALQVASSPAPAPARPQPVASTHAAPEGGSLAPEEIWQRVCQVLGHSLEKSRTQPEQDALRRCSTWLGEADLQRLEADERRKQAHPLHRSESAYSFLNFAEGRVRKIKPEATSQASVGQPAQPTNGQASMNGHKRPTADEVFAYISPKGWPIEVAQAYINARTRTDPPWHLPATNDRPARPIAADWHADVHRFLTNWLEVEKKKSATRDLDEELF